MSELLEPVCFELHITWIAVSIVVTGTVISSHLKIRVQDIADGWKVLIQIMMTSVNAAIGSDYQFTCTAQYLSAILLQAGVRKLITAEQSAMGYAEKFLGSKIYAAAFSDCLSLNYQVLLIGMEYAPDANGEIRVHEPLRFFQQFVQLHLRWMVTDANGSVWRVASESVGIDPMNHLLNIEAQIRKDVDSDTVGQVVDNIIKAGMYARLAAGESDWYRALRSVQISQP